MDNDLDAILARYRKFFDQLSDESVEEFREFASPNVHYRDPVMDVREVNEVVARMHKWFADLDGLRFETEDHVRDGRRCFQTCCECACRCGQVCRSKNAGLRSSSHPILPWDSVYVQGPGAYHAYREIRHRP